MKLVSVDQMREIENKAGLQGLPSPVLMENAGLAVAREIREWVGEVEGLPILVLVGPGNNGGDGLVAARHLHDWGGQVHLYLVRDRRPDDVNYRICRERGIHIIVAGEDADPPELDTLMPYIELVVDSLFGTGKVRPLQGPAKRILGKVREARETGAGLQLAAVDLPSGLDADTGKADESCLAADITITLGYPKKGLFMFPGASRLGHLVIADIGIPDELAEDVRSEIITEEMVADILPARPSDANKGTFGKLLVIGGSANYIGALYLACMGAARVGAGLVRLGVAQSLQPILAAKLTETVYLPLQESSFGIVAPDAADDVLSILDEHDALLLGCGLGQSREASAFLRRLLLENRKLPKLVLDADALNILSQIPLWWQMLPQDAIMTPHPGEMSRLTDLSVKEVQSRRVEIASEAAASWNKTVVLKGAYTVIAAPDGRVVVNPSANPGLASAGTGDVLAGAMGGFMAQGLSLFDAAVAGVYVHAQAGHMLKEDLGDTGTIASDLLPLMPRVIRTIREEFA